MRWRWMLLATALAAVLLASACEVSQSDYEAAQVQIGELQSENESLQQERDAAKASLATCQSEVGSIKAENVSLAQYKETSESKAAEAARWAAVLDVTMNDILVSLMSRQGEPTAGSLEGGGGPSQELMAALMLRIAMSGDPALQAMANELLAERQQPSLEKVMQLDAMIRASGDPELTDLWEQVLASAGGGPQMQQTPFHLLEEVIRASGDPTLIGKFELLKGAMETRQGPPIMALVELADAVEASGNRGLIVGFNAALETDTSGTGFTLTRLVKLGRAVRAVKDPTLEDMMERMFTDEGGEEAFASFLAYTTRKLTGALR